MSMRDVRAGEQGWCCCSGARRIEARGGSCTDIGCPARGSVQSEMCRHGHSHGAVVFYALLTYRVANAMAWDPWSDRSVIWPGAVLRIRSRWHCEAGGLAT